MFPAGERGERGQGMTLYQFANVCLDHPSLEMTCKAYVQEPRLP